jgi:hypothetical protein
MDGVLAALIGMKQPLFWGTLQFDRHSQSCAGQRGILNHRKRKSHNAASIQIQNCCEKHPASTDPDIGYITTLRLIDYRDIELALEHMERRSASTGRFLLTSPARMTGNTGFEHPAASHVSPDTMPSSFQLLGQGARPCGPSAAQLLTPSAACRRQMNSKAPCESNQCTSTQLKKFVDMR